MQNKREFEEKFREFLEDIVREFEDIWFEFPDLSSEFHTKDVFLESSPKVCFVRENFDEDGLMVLHVSISYGSYTKPILDVFGNKKEVLAFRERVRKKYKEFLEMMKLERAEV